LTFRASNPLPQVNSIKNRELNAKLTVVQRCTWGQAVFV
jgi:hypothetical protein